MSIKSASHYGVQPFTVYSQPTTPSSSQKVTQATMTTYGGATVQYNKSPTMMASSNAVSNSTVTSKALQMNGVQAQVNATNDIGSTSSAFSKPITITSTGSTGGERRKKSKKSKKSKRTKRTKRTTKSTKYRKHKKRNTYKK